MWDNYLVGANAMLPNPWSICTRSLNALCVASQIQIRLFFIAFLAFFLPIFIVLKENLPMWLCLLQLKHMLTPCHELNLLLCFGIHSCCTSIFCASNMLPRTLSSYPSFPLSPRQWSNIRTMSTILLKSKHLQTSQINFLALMSDVFEVWTPPNLSNIFPHIWTT